MYGDYVGAEAEGRFEIKNGKWVELPPPPPTLSFTAGGPLAWLKALGVFHLETQLINQHDVAESGSGIMMLQAKGRRTQVLLRIDSQLRPGTT